MIQFQLQNMNSLAMMFQEANKVFITSTGKYSSLNEPDPNEYKFQNNRYGFASTVASQSKGTNLGFQHRKSDSLLHSHISRDINYERQPSWIEKGFFSKDKVKFDPTYPAYHALSFGRAKINDHFDVSLPNLKMNSSKGKRRCSTSI